MHDLDPQKRLSKSPEEDTYSLYSLGILLGILAVAFNLVVAIIAAANGAIATHLSLRPPLKESIFEQRLLLCMMSQFFAAVMAEVSLFLLSTNIHDTFFTICVGALFFLCFCTLGHHVWVLLGLDWAKSIFKMSILKTLYIASLFLSTLASTLALGTAYSTVWFTILIYYLTIVCHSLYFSTRLALNLGTIISLPCLSVLWSLVSFGNIFTGGWLSSKLATMVVSVIESALLMHMFMELRKELYRTRQRLKHTRVPTEPF